MAGFPGSFCLRGTRSLGIAIGLAASFSEAISEVARPVSSLTAALACHCPLTGPLQSLVLLDLRRGWLSQGCVQFPHLFVCFGLAWWLSYHLFLQPRQISAQWDSTRAGCPALCQFADDKRVAAGVARGRGRG